MDVIAPVLVLQTLHDLSDRETAEAVRCDIWWRVARKVAADRVISVTDPEGRHVHKSVHHRQDGFKGHVVIVPVTGLFTAGRRRGRPGRDLPRRRHPADQRQAQRDVGDRLPGLPAAGPLHHRQRRPDPETVRCGRPGPNGDNNPACARTTGSTVPWSRVPASGWSARRAAAAHWATARRATSSAARNLTSTGAQTAMSAPFPSRPPIVQQSPQPMASSRAGAIGDG
ncbi:hypothetical protein I1A49_46640 [Streptomyces malaysiensis subsp. malaysiensis]|uniref:Transposase IS701-like DDE domain-containing protein n=1 Tax=Streptomyces malaysiensis TaxID=92644 RepID=A0ABX6WIW8_STRMQ|nr:hypothetical protein I1A49_46640 [Streptomyces solisilvae]